MWVIARPHRAHRAGRAPRRVRQRVGGVEIGQRGYQGVGSRGDLVVPAYDPDRADWRSFRIDRMAEPAPARTSFTPRPLPHDDLGEHVRRGRSRTDAAHRVVIEVARPADDLRSAYGRWVEVIEIDGGWCRVMMDVDDFTWPLHVLANAGAPVRVIEPAALKEQVAATAAEWAAATA